MRSRSTALAPPGHEIGGQRHPGPGFQGDRAVGRRRRCRDGRQNQAARKCPGGSPHSRGPGGCRGRSGARLPMSLHRPVPPGLLRGGRGQGEFCRMAVISPPVRGGELLLLRPPGAWRRPPGRLWPRAGRGDLAGWRRDVAGLEVLGSLVSWNIRSSGKVSGCSGRRRVSIPAGHRRKRAAAAGGRIGPRRPQAAPPALVDWKTDPARRSSSGESGSAAQGRTSHVPKYSRTRRGSLPFRLFAEQAL